MRLLGASVNKGKRMHCWGNTSRGWSYVPIMETTQCRQAAREVEGE
jgi:hypothetical protein